MRRRLLALCMLAYPSVRRERDGDYVRDLALELAETSGLLRQAVSLLQGGLSERIERRRRSRGAGPPVWLRRVVIGCFVVGAMAFAASGLSGIAAGEVDRVEVDRLVCADAGESRSKRDRGVDALGGCARDHDGSTRPDDSGRTDASIQRFLDGILPAGASGTLVAARADKRVYCEGFGMADRNERTPARCDTVYDVMSMTKQFTAAAILKLQMMGKLKVTDPIGKYIGAVPADKRAITLQQLLAQTSGLIDSLGGDYERLSRRAMVTGALESKLRARPGAEYHYSNLGYSLLAAIIERASGIGYEEFLAKHLFAPAGMRQTGYVLPRWRSGRVAVEYDPRGKPHGRPFDHPWAKDGPYWNLRGNGGMLSTARDMLRWHRALGGDKVLDRRSKHELFKRRVLEEPGGNAYYAYGWVIQESDLGTVAWHNGGNGWSYGELTRLLDDEVMVFWVTNRYKNKVAGWSFQRLGRELTRGVVDLVGKTG